MKLVLLRSSPWQWERSPFWNSRETWGSGGGVNFHWESWWKAWRSWEASTSLLQPENALSWIPGSVELLGRRPASLLASSRCLLWSTHWRLMAFKMHASFGEPKIQLLEYPLWKISWWKVSFWNILFFDCREFDVDLPFFVADSKLNDGLTADLSSLRASALQKQSPVTCWLPHFSRVTSHNLHSSHGTCKPTNQQRTTTKPMPAAMRNLWCTLALLCGPQDSTAATLDFRVQLQQWGTFSVSRPTSTDCIWDCTDQIKYQMENLMAKGGWSLPETAAGSDSDRETNRRNRSLARIFCPKICWCHWTSSGEFSTVFFVISCTFCYSRCSSHWCWTGCFTILFSPRTREKQRQGADFATLEYYFWATVDGCSILAWKPSGTDCQWWQPNMIYAICTGQCSLRLFPGTGQNFIPFLNWTRTTHF